MSQEKVIFTGYDPVHLTGALTMISALVYVFQRYETSYPIELVILSVALVAYLLLSSLPKPLWLRIRYIDWFLTVPLLVYVVSKYGSAPFWLLALLVIGMLGSGYLAVLGNKQSYSTWITLGFVFYLGFAGTLFGSNNSLPWWLIYPFFLSWGLYGFVDRIEGPRDHWAYTALDIINKPLFIALLLNHLETA